MDAVDDAALETFLAAMAPPHGDVQAEMAERAEEEGFPIIGRPAGATLYQLATLTDARRIFEFGSGFGYSATWFARALGPDGQIVLTEEDDEELDLAREYLRRCGVAERAAFEAGDALATVDRYEGPFDVVLIDHAKEQYREAFERVRAKVPTGGVIVADNALSAGPMDTAGIVREIVEDGSADALDDAMAAGVVAYLQALRADPAFATTVVPVGSGLALSVRTD